MTRSRSTKNLLPTGYDNWLARIMWSSLSTQDKILDLEQVILGMNNAQECLNNALKKRNGIVEKCLHYPSIDQVYSVTDGSVCLCPEDISEPCANPPSFWDLIITILGDDLRINRKERMLKILEDRKLEGRINFEEELFFCAFSLFSVDNSCRDKWRERFKFKLCVSYDDFVRAFVGSDARRLKVKPGSEEFKVLEKGYGKMVKAIFTIVKSELEQKKLPSMDEVSFYLFIEVCKVYGEWWNPPMRDALFKIVNDNPPNGICFLVDNSSGAVTFLTHPDHRNCIGVVRPRSYPDPKAPSKVLYPFAITTRRGDDISHYVISFDNNRRSDTYGRFFIRDGSLPNNVLLADVFKDGADIFKLCEDLLSI